MTAGFAIVAVAGPSWFSVVLHLALLLLLVALSGTFPGSETVLFALTPVQLQHQADSEAVPRHEELPPKFTRQSCKRVLHGVEHTAEWVAA